MDRVSCISERYGENDGPHEHLYIALNMITKDELHLLLGHPLRKSSDGQAELELGNERKAILRVWETTCMVLFGLY